MKAKPKASKTCPKVPPSAFRAHTAALLERGRKAEELLKRILDWMTQYSEDKEVGRVRAAYLDLTADDRPEELKK